MKEFNRNEGRETEGYIYVYEHESEDIEVVVRRHGNVINILEMAGGYIEHEIAENVESLQKAKQKAEQYIKSGEQQ
jgi:hypothetical protein